MSSSFNFSFSSSLGRQKKNDKKRLSAQEEYWLDRILRDHSGQIFILVLLFLLTIIGTVIYAVLSPQNTSVSGERSLIKIDIK